MRDQNLTYYPENVSLADNGLKRNYLSANSAIMRYNACCFINFTGEQTYEIDGPLDNAECQKLGREILFREAVLTAVGWKRGWVGEKADGDRHSRAHCGVCDKRIFYFRNVPRFRIIWRVAVSRVIRENYDGVGDPLNSLDSTNRC